MENVVEHSEEKLSIVVPTYNRADDLEDLLFSILEQTTLPQEVVIVDDSENSGTRDLTDQVRRHFSRKGIVLKYLHNPKRSSASAARNKGMLHITGEITLFLDDDIVLEKRYIKEILKIYRNYPNTQGVQGYIINTPKLESLSHKLRNQFRKIFFLVCFEKDMCRVLPTGTNTYPNQISKVIRCQWLHGCNLSLKSQVLKANKFDENLRRYSFLEDVDLSYRVFKKHPDSLYMTPHAKLFHKWSKAQRLPIKILTYTQTINRTYFFYKHTRQTLLNKLIYIWSNAGRITFFSIMLFKHMLSVWRKKPLSEIRYLRALVKSYNYALKHLKEIKRGDLRFFEEMF